MPRPVSKKTIAVDLDDVLAEHIEALIGYSNQNHGTDFKPEDYLEQWVDLWGIPYEEVVKRAKDFHIPETVENFSIVRDAKPALAQLKKDWNLVIVTARPKDTIASTLKWVDKHFSGIFSDVHFVPIWDPGPKVTKAEICNKIGANYLIDDLARHCNLAAEMGVSAILFERIKWKQPEKVHPDVIRVKNWREVLEYFNAKG